MKPVLPDGWSERLRELLGDQSVRNFAHLCNISPSAMRAYIEGTSEPGGAALVAIAHALGVSVESLVFGEASVRDDNETPHKPEIGVEFNLIPRYDVEASGGHGRFVERESEIGKLAFRTDWLRQKGLDPNDLVVIRIVGDSMSPTIRDGSLLLVNADEGRSVRDGIYVLRLDGELIAKRIQKDVVKGGLYIKSDNPAYSEQYIPADEIERLYIVGRVIWSGGEV